MKHASRFKKELCALFFVFFIQSYLSAQAPSLTTAPGVEVTIYNDDYDFNSKLILFSQRSLESAFGIPQSYNSSIALHRAKSPWPPFWVAQVSSQNNGVSIAQDFVRNWDGSYFFWQAKADGQIFTFSNYIWLDKDFLVLDTLWNLEADPHGIWLTRDNKIVWARRDTMNYTFPGDSLLVLGEDLYLYDPVANTNTLIWKRDSSFNAGYLNPEYIDEGDVNSEVRDGSHFNWVCEAPDGNILINDRHTGYGKINRSTGQIIWWGGLPVGFPNTLTPIKGATFGDVQSHLGHCFHYISKGPYAGYYTWFDNGDINQPYSRVPVISINETNNSVELIDEFKFPYSPCMGSVQFLDDGTFIVDLGCNIPISFLQVLESGADSATIAQAIQQMYVEGSPPGIYWMTLDGDTLATYTLPVLHAAYTVEVVDSADLPETISIDCDGSSVEALELTLVPQQSQQQWSNGDSAPSIMVSAPGSYYAGTPYGIGMAYTKNHVVNNGESCFSTTGIDQSSISKDVVLYPNPGYLGGTLTLDIDNAVDFYGSRVTAINMLGQETELGVFFGSPLAIHTVKPGMYFIALNEIVMGKAVIIH